MRKAFTFIEFLIVIAIIVALMLLTGFDIGIFEPPFQLVCGWAFFLWRVLPRMTIDLANTVMVVGQINATLIVTVQ